MKIVERNFENRIDVAAAVCLWNHWDHEHLTVIHRKNYTDCKILYEQGDTLVWLVSVRVPVFRFMVSHSMGTVVLRQRKGGGGTVQQYNMGLFGIPSITTIEIMETGHDSSMVRTNYKFLLHGWRRMLAPVLYRLLAKWNQQVWNEDLPLRLRRQKVLGLGFRDFVGLPDKVADRFNQGPHDVQIPLRRPKDSPVNAFLGILGRGDGKAIPAEENDAS